MTISLNYPSTSSLEERYQKVDYAAVYVDKELTSPKCVPKKKRMRMIAKEMQTILEDAQDYLLSQFLDSDVSEEAKNALFKAAMNSAYLEHKFDTTINKVVFYPTCKDLIKNHGMIDDAEEFYYSARDELPSEYRVAIDFAARDAERKIQKREREQSRELSIDDLYDSDEDTLSECSEVALSLDTLTVHYDAKIMEELSNSWSERLRDYHATSSDIDSDEFSFGI